MNDPTDVIEDLELENFNFYHLEKSFKNLIRKLNINLPQRLYVPFTASLVINYLADKITMTENNFIIDFDPRSLGLMSPRVQSMLKNITHPEVDMNPDHTGFSVTMDQNMLNALIIEMSMTKQQISVRNSLSIFDRKAQWIKMLSTNLLRLNMPQLIAEYGNDKQFDIILTIDQEFFHKHKEAPYNGLHIDQMGNLTGNINFVGYMKVNRDANIKYIPGTDDYRTRVLGERSKKSNFAWEDDEEGYDEQDEIDELEPEVLDEWFQKLITSDSEDWEIARTIYGQVNINAHVGMDGVYNETNVLIVDF